MKIKFNGELLKIPSMTRTVNDLLLYKGINRETVAVLLNGELAIEEHLLKEGDEVKSIKAVSGG